MYLCLLFLASLFSAAGLTALINRNTYGRQYPLFDKFPILTFRKYAVLMCILAVITWVALLYFFN